MAFGETPLYDTRATAVAGSTTVYVPVPIEKGAVGLFIGWTDATSSATLTLEFTSLGPNTAAYDSTTAWHWEDSGLTIAGPAASAAGATIVNVDNCRQKRARLKIVTAANTKMIVMNGVSNA